MGSEIDDDLYRKVLGRYPTGVTLVTGMDGDEPLAMVIGSFVSVSMDTETKEPITMAKGSSPSIPVTRVTPVG